MATQILPADELQRPEEIRIEIQPGLHATFYGSWAQMIDEGLVARGTSRPNRGASLEWEEGGLAFEIRRAPIGGSKAWIQGDHWRCVVEPTQRPDDWYEGWAIAHDNLTLRQRFVTMNLRHASRDRIEAARSDRTVQDLLSRSVGKKRRR